MISIPWFAKALYVLAQTEAWWLPKDQGTAIKVHGKHGVYQFGEKISFNCTGENAPEFDIQINNHDISRNMTKVLGPKVLYSAISIDPQHFKVGDNLIVCNGGTMTEDIRVESYLVRDVTDIKCIVRRPVNLLECRWTIGEYHFKEFINVTFSVKRSDNDQWSSCHPTITPVQSCPFQDFNDSDFIHLKLQVKNTKRNISKTFEMMNILQLSLVKPVMVENVRASNITSRTALIQWSLAHEAETLLVRLNISSKLNRQTFINEDIEEYQLTNLKPFTKYRIVIDSRLQGGRYYSDPSVISFKTASDVPEIPPVINPGSFYIKNQFCTVHSTGQLRNVTVFWKSIPERYRNGRIIKFVLSVNGSDGRDYQNVVDGNQTSTDVVLECDVNYDIKVKASTSAGLSNFSAVLKVPAYKDISPIKNIVVQTPENRSFVNISWTVNNKISSCSIFWCTKGQESSNCDGEMHSKETFHSTYQVIYQTYLTDPISLLKFGVSGISDTSSPYSSGITWETCRYKLDQAPAIPEGLNIAQKNPYKSLIVLWSDPICDWQSGYVNKYIVKYCLQKDTVVCKEKEFHPRKVAEYTLEGLTAFQNYSVQLQTVSPLGKKSPFTAPVYGVPDSNELTNLQITGIIIAAVVLVIICLILCIIRQKYRMSKLPYNVEVPDLSKKTEDNNINTSAIKSYETRYLQVPNTSTSLQISDTNSDYQKDENLNIKCHKTQDEEVSESSNHLQIWNKTEGHETDQMTRKVIRHVSIDSGNESCDSESLRRENSIGLDFEGNLNSQDDCVKLNGANLKELPTLQTDYLKQVSGLSNNDYISNDTIIEVQPNALKSQNEIHDVNQNVFHVELETIEEDDGDDCTTLKTSEDEDITSYKIENIELPSDYVRSQFDPNVMLDYHGYLPPDNLYRVQQNITVSGPDQAMPDGSMKGVTSSEDYSYVRVDNVIPWVS